MSNTESSCASDLNNELDDIRNQQIRQIRLDNEKKEGELILIKNSYSNDALSKKMEAARRNIEVLSKMWTLVAGSKCFETNTGGIEKIIMSNILALSEIEKFKV